ncbi:hypothetical protein T492DRAFT_847734 [Pavlovales sp. CCMP2436]|nr:hypothetical protein T492DRAFT_847734 [Pavlovales sp. CCMP2436]
MRSSQLLAAATLLCAADALHHTGMSLAVARRHAAASRARVVLAAAAEAEEEWAGGEEGAAVAVVESPFEVGQPVRVEVTGFSPLGCNVRVDALADGLVFSSELAYPPRLGTWTGLPLRKGDVVPGYVTQARDDGKLDISLRKFGFAKAEAARAALLLALLASPDRRLALGDASSSEAIRSALAISKAQFKSASGALWKAGVIDRPSPEELRLAPGVNDKSKKGKAGEASDAESENAIVFVQGLPFSATPDSLVTLLRAYHPSAPKSGADIPAGAPDASNWIASIRGLELRPRGCQRMLGSSARSCARGDARERREALLAATPEGTPENAGKINN